jgi:hypothetical protein
MIAEKFVYAMKKHAPIAIQLALNTRYYQNSIARILRQESDVNLDSINFNKWLIVKNVKI